MNKKLKELDAKNIVIEPAVGFNRPKAFVICGMQEGNESEGINPRMVSVLESFIIREIPDDEYTETYSDSTGLFCYAKKRLSSFSLIIEADYRSHNEIIFDIYRYEVNEKALTFVTRAEYKNNLWDGGVFTAGFRLWPGSDGILYSINVMRKSLNRFLRRARKARQKRGR